MTSRRQFLKAGLAASALQIAARADIGAAEPPAATVSLYKVLYDTRFPASVAFARRAAARGLAVHAMAGDMTRFWYDDLYHRWRQGPAAIAGLTGEGALFCLERLAWEQRMRVVYRGEHAAGGRRVRRASVRRSGAVAARGRCRDCGRGVGGGVGRRRGRVPARSRAARRGAVVDGERRRWPPSAEALFSWVIAPVQRA